MKKLIALLLGATILCSAFAGCAKTTETSTSTETTMEETVAPSLEADADYDGEVTASGSSAVFPLAEEAANLFMDKYPNSIITVAAGGSGTGLKQVAAQEVTIGNSDLFAEEKLEADQAALLIDHKVCLLTVAPVVNPDLGLIDITTEDLIGIFTGEITNWSEIGGPDLKIMLITRPSSSGTRALFSTYAMNGAEEIVGDLENDNSGELKQAVVDNVGAIGYLALSYIDDSIATVSIDGVAPTFENVYSGDYTVWGYEHCYTNTTAERNETAEAFLAFMMSDEFAPNIEALGYGATSKLSAAAIASHETTDTTALEENADYDGEVTASGSSAVFPLAEEAANLFMDKYPNSIITVAAGGSGTGLKQVAAQEVTIGNSDLFAEEKLEADQAALLIDHKVCLLTVAPVVNPDLGLIDITTEDLIGIFTGEITNWSEIGGPDLKIMLITRPSSSGTRALFSTYAMNGAEEIVGDLENDNSGELKQAVLDNVGAIGYLALSYIDDSITAVSIDGVAPTFENVYAGDYAVWGYEHCYTNSQAETNETAEAFLAFMMSDEFAPNIEAMGYGASSKLTDAAIATHE